ncbi:MAG: hypothetical protein IK072_01960, partial [Clostridia bacterium]|nr:hypothetical protein [Clostridia bacterium]
MPWTNLPTNYADAQWTGDRKYTINLGSGGTYQNATITDTTEYSPTTPGGNYFYGANDANQTNDAINKIVAAQGGEVLYYNASGTNGTITLSEACENFQYIEIYFSGSAKASVKFYVDSEKTVDLNNYNIWSGDDKFIYWRHAVVVFSQNTVTWSKNAW